MTGRNAEIRAWVKAHRESILAAAVTILLAVGALVNSDSEGAGVVTRREEGQTSVQETFSYETKEGKTQEIALEVYARERSEKEAKKLLATAVSDWEEGFLGENPSVNEVRTDLKLPNALCDGLVTVSYAVSEPDLIGEDGSVAAEEIPQEGSLVELQAEFSYASYTQTEIRTLQLLPPKKGSAAWIRMELLRLAGQAEQDSRTEASFLLPTQIDGISVQWSSSRDQTWLWILVLGGAAVFCLEWKKKEAEKKKKREREEQLLREYPQMAEQMLLLLGAGLTIRRAWERLLHTEEAMAKTGGRESALFVQEMQLTYHEIQKGCGEKESYERFGKRIGLLPYRRFAALLARNVEKGTRDLCDLLSAEAREAWEMRKHQARRLGEEAGMKLLFPMMFLFLMILVILLFPALQNMY